MPESFTFTVNGTEERVSGVPGSRTLLSVLRASGHTGTKEGCGDGDCGACTVAIVGQGAGGEPTYLAVNSCIVPVAQVAGRDIVTVEGLANTELHPVQQAMIATGGSQCGYCTPGFIMSMFTAYYDGTLGDEAIEGNLCRCTGYLPIRRAMASLGGPSSTDRFVERLALHSRSSPDKATGGNEETYVARGQSYRRPKSLDELLAMLRDNSEATMVAGATDLGLEFSWHRGSYPTLVDVTGVGELHVIDDADKYLEVGAAVPLTHVERRLHGRFPALDDMLAWFAARQIRNRATIGGNLGTASPIGDLPPVLMALGATVKLRSSTAEREVPVSDFFTGYRTTVRRADEVIVSVVIPKALPAGATTRLSRAYKVAKRGSDDISTVASAYALDLDDSGRIVQARLAYGGVAPKPVHADALEHHLLGRPWDEQTAGEGAERLKRVFAPITDVRGSAGYRSTVAGNLFYRFYLDTTGPSRGRSAEAELP